MPVRKKERAGRHKKSQEGAMQMKEEEQVLYTFIAGAAIKGNDPFPVQCNCGGIITIMPPMQENEVICPNCETTIKMLVIEGDPG